MLSNPTVQIGSLEATLRGVALPNGLVLDEVVVRGSEASIVPNPFSLTLPEPATAQVTVTQAAVQALLASQLPDTVRDAVIKIVPGFIEAQATVRMLFEIRATARFVLRIVDDTKVFVEVDSVDVLGAAAKNMLQAQLAPLNPIFDATTLPLRLKLVETRIEEGRVVILGLVEGTL